MYVLYSQVVVPVHSVQKHRTWIHKVSSEQFIDYGHSQSLSGESILIAVCFYHHQSTIEYYYFHCPVSANLQQLEKYRIIFRSYWSYFSV